jgi:glycosyltransferase involved in cell wall biosynthesis
MKLSLLVPSNRPEGLERLRKSLELHSVCADQWELVVLVDDEKEYVEYHHGYTEIHYPPKSPLSIAHLLHECYKLSHGEWVMFANDDITCETPEWDKMLLGAIEQYGKDEVCLFWPDDNMFGPKLSCFPIVSKRMLDMVNFWPQPYQRYKVDDTIHFIVPNTRRFYLSNIKFTHHNADGKAGHGYMLEDRRVYPINQEAGTFDQAAWEAETSRRNQMKRVINEYLGISTPKILVAVPTLEMARRADFYSHMDLIDVPANVEVLKQRMHGQSPAKGRNLAIERAQENACTHILFIDDDVYPPFNIIEKLLAHDKDIVTALYLARHYPHRPYLFCRENPDGSHIWKHLHPDETGLIEVTNAGLGACLIKMSVFDKLEKPYVRLGELEADNWCDDIGLFNRCRKVGFKLYADLDCFCGHAAGVVIFPERRDGKWWTTYYTTSGEGRALIAQPEPNPDMPQPEKELVNAT